MTPKEFQSRIAEFESRVAELERLSEDLRSFKASIDARIKRNEINSKEIVDEYLSRRQKEIQDQDRAARAERSQAEKRLKEIANGLERDRAFLESQRSQDREAVERMFEEKSLGFPWLARAYSDYAALRDNQFADYLKEKAHPALKGAEILRIVCAERRQAERERRVTKYLLEYYENLFPWLVDFRGEDLDDLIKHMVGTREDVDTENGSDQARTLLTQAEYNLPPVEKYQRALDRWWDKKKRPWEIGRIYERYIGYLYEKAGFQVSYQGIVKGLEDLGRDLICTSGDAVEVVQCKCWSQTKTIHEKFINQLFGTTVTYWIERQGSTNKQLELFPSLLARDRITPSFITSTTLSETAKRFAEALGVKVAENFPLVRYPSVKCNVARRSGERIYHLPFDQQYDTTLVEEERNECYVETVAEAEKLGFRRAFRWRGKKTDQPKKA